MTPDTTLVVVWLVFAHLVADFVLQNDWIAINKANGTREGYRALLTHGFHVVAVPRARRARVRRAGPRLPRARRRLAHARGPLEGPGDAARRGGRPGAGPRPARPLGFLVPSGLGGAWTPWPGMLFLADQALHMTFALVGWLDHPRERAAHGPVGRLRQHGPADVRPDRPSTRWCSRASCSSRCSSSTPAARTTSRWRSLSPRELKPEPPAEARRQQPPRPPPHPRRGRADERRSGRGAAPDRVHDRRVRAAAHRRVRHARATPSASPWWSPCGSRADGASSRTAATWSTSCSRTLASVSVAVASALLAAAALSSLA